MEESTLIYGKATSVPTRDINKMENAEMKF